MPTGGGFAGGQRVSGISRAQAPTPHQEERSLRRSHQLAAPLGEVGVRAGVPSREGCEGWPRGNGEKAPCSWMREGPLRGEEPPRGPTNQAPFRWPTEVFTEVCGLILRPGEEGGPRVLRSRNQGEFPEGCTERRD